MTSGHIASQINNPALRTDNTLHVIGVIQNPVRYHSRYRLFREWAARMTRTPNVKLHVVEAVYGDRQSECAPSCEGEYSHHEVRIHSEIWLKENLINIGVRNSLPKNWKYMAWVDCDVTFADSHWALNTIHQLQHWNILQPWSQATDLDFHGGIHATHQSFGFLAATGKKKGHGKGEEGYTYAHTGFAWACTRYFYENIEKLLDFCIIGSGDHHMAWGCVGGIAGTIHSGVTPGYQQACSLWEAKAQRACAKQVGYLHGRIEHNFHGPKERRAYWSRWDIITRNAYDPTKDLAYDSQGVLLLKGPHKHAIERQVRLYNRARLEDSIEQY